MTKNLKIKLEKAETKSSLKDVVDLLVLENGYPDLSKKKTKLTTSNTLITADEEVYFTIGRPGSGEISIKLEAYFAHVIVNGSGRLELDVFTPTPITGYFTVPPSSGFFNGNESILLEDELTPLTFQLSGDEFEEEEQGNTLLIILAHAVEGTSPSQIVHEGALVYSVVSPYSASRKKKAKSKKKK